MLMNILMIFVSALAYATPIIFAGIGGLYSERSGVVNVGLEGMMVIGAFVGALISFYFGQQLGGFMMILVALLAAGIIGALFASLHAVASVSFKANQVISGTALNMLALALTSFLVKILFDGASEAPGSTVAYSMTINILGFELNWTFLLILGVTILTAFIFSKTKLGLRLRAVGENPSAVDTAGISVTKLRYFAVILSGVLAGVGGAIVVLTFVGGKFQASTISGLGFLGLASLVFGKWKPWGVFSAALFFGFCQSFANTASAYFPAIVDIIPNYILKILPYVFTIIALVLFSRRAVAPKASGTPYDKGER
jgi:Uncharacterized ABC-type transport system, permease component